MEKLKIGFANLGLLWLRVLMGLGIAYHGYGKLFTEEIAKMAIGVEKMGFPSPEIFAYAAALSEFAGGIFIALGLFTRVAAFFVFFTMSVAAFKVHLHHPTFYSPALKTGFKELALCYWTMAGTMIFTGPGAFSMDKLLFGRKKKEVKKKENQEEEK